MFDLITAPQTLAQPTQVHRYMVQLASNELVIDTNGIPVPKEFRTVDVCVAEPSLDAIAALLQAAGHLEDYGIVSHWIPQDCDCF